MLLLLLFLCGLTWSPFSLQASLLSIVTYRQTWSPFFHMGKLAFYFFRRAFHYSGWASMASSTPMGKLWSSPFFSACILCGASSRSVPGQRLWAQRPCQASARKRSGAGAQRRGRLGGASLRPGQPIPRRPAAALKAEWSKPAPPCFALHRRRRRRLFLGCHSKRPGRGSGAPPPPAPKAGGRN